MLDQRLRFTFVFEVLVDVRGGKYMTTKQKVLKMGIIIFILVLVVGGAVYFIQWKKGQDKKAEPPKTEIPKEEVDIVPTLDPSLSDEEKAIQIIINQTKLKKNDLQYLEITKDGLYRVKNIKETTKNEKVHYLVDLKTETYQTVMTMSRGAA